MIQPSTSLILTSIIWVLANTAISGHLKTCPDHALRPILSGFSTWAAHAIWIDLQCDIEKNNTEHIIRKISLATQLAPDNLFFRINGAGIIGYDTYSPRKQSSTNIAIKLLVHGQQLDPGNPYINYELGKLYLLKHQDPELAKHHFRKASQAK